MSKKNLKNKICLWIEKQIYVRYLLSEKSKLNIA